MVNVNTATSARVIVDCEDSAHAIRLARPIGLGSPCIPSNPHLLYSHQLQRTQRVSQLPRTDMTSVWLVALTVFGWALSASEGGDSTVYLIYGRYRVTFTTHRIATGGAQRCYSFSCFDNRAKTIWWQNIQATSKLAFYTEPKCKGEIYIVGGSAGSVPLSDSKPDFSVSSFMIWESGMYPTGGIVDDCPPPTMKALRG